MGCASSGNKKPSTERTTFDDFDDEEHSLNPHEFKCALQLSVAVGSQTSIQNVNIISLARFQDQNAIIAEYTIQKDGVTPNLLSHMSMISTYISNGSMSSALQTNGFPNVSANDSHCFIKFADVSVGKKKRILKVTQKIHCVVVNEYASDSWKGVGQDPEKLAWEMSQEVNTIISKQKHKKEDSKASPPEAQCTSPGPDKNYGFDDDTITKVNRQIRDMSAMKKRDIEKKYTRDSKCDDEVAPFSEEAIMSGGAATLSGICKRAIRKSLESVIGADLDSINIVSARDSDGRAGAELTVVYTVSIRLSNVSALVKIIADALGKGRAKVFLEGIGWPAALTRGKVLESTSFVTMYATQKFIGLSLPSGCTHFDFTDPDVFSNYPSSTSRLWELQTECRMNSAGDFYCSVNETANSNERKEFLNDFDMQLLHVEESARISKMLNLSHLKNPDASSDSKDKRVTFQNFIMRSKSAYCMGKMPAIIRKDPNDSEYHIKYEEIVVGVKREPSFRLSDKESKMDPSECTENSSRKSSIG